MVYGHFNGKTVTEETPCEPLGIYGALKFSGEKLVIAYNQVFGMNYTIIRPSALYGERCISRRVGQVFIENALRGDAMCVAGDGSDRLDFTYIADLVEERTLGSASEYIVVPAHLAVPLPETASFADGACLGIPALTAHRCVFRDGPVTDQTILVTGGAGAVGQYAVQFAKLGGARVLTTVSTDDKAELARKCAADVIIRYKDENVSERVRELTDGEGVDRIVEVEFGGNMTTSLEVLKPNGVIAAYASDAVKEPALPFYQLLYRNVTLRCELVFLMPDEAKREAVEDITGWLENNELTHNFGPSFSLDEIVAAHEAVEAGAFGKVIVQISD